MKYETAWPSGQKVDLFSSFYLRYYIFFGGREEMVAMLALWRWNKVRRFRHSSIGGAMRLATSTATDVRTATDKVVFMGRCGTLMPQSQVGRPTSNSSNSCF